MLPNNFLKLAFISILFLTTSIFAQTDTTLIDKGVNIFFYNGLGISYKYNANETFSYRVNVGLSTSLSDSETEKDYYYFDASNYYDTSSYSNDGNNTNFTANLSYSVLYNLIKEKTLNLYIGAGPSIIYSYSKEESNSYRENTVFYNSELQTTKYYGVGIAGLVGIDAYLSNNITLFAESQISLHRNWRKEDGDYAEFYSISGSPTHTRQTRSTSSNLQMDFTLVKVGFGIYF